MIRLQIVAFAAVFCVALMLSRTEANPVNITTATDAPTVSTTTDLPATEKAQCVLNMQPCGWAVYGKGERNKIQYFIHNTCTCDKATQKCLLDGEDLSLSAYVYRCKSRNRNA